MKTVSCCKRCEECPNCYELDEEKLREYLFAIDNQVTNYNKSYICLQEWGYACKPTTYETFETLMIFRDYIDYYYNSVKFDFKSGICDKEIQKVLESTSKLVDLTFYRAENKTNVDIDDTGYEIWVKENPTCVAWEDWEFFIADLCPKIGIKVVNVTQSCKVVYDIKVQNIKNTCKFLYTLTVLGKAIENNCLDVKFSAKLLEECKLQYKALVKEYLCDFSFKTYTKLLECNLSNKVISNLLECNLKLDYSVVDKCPIIKSESGDYKLTDIKVNMLDPNVDYTCLNDYLRVNRADMTQEEIDALTESYEGLHSIEIN